MTPPEMMADRSVADFAEGMFRKDEEARKRIDHHKESAQRRMEPIIREFAEMNRRGIRIHSWASRHSGKIGDPLPETCNGWLGEGVELNGRYGKIHIHPETRGGAYPSNLERYFRQDDEDDEGFEIIYGDFHFWARSAERAAVWVVETLGTDWLTNAEVPA